MQSSTENLKYIYDSLVNQKDSTLIQLFGTYQIILDSNIKISWATFSSQSLDDYLKTIINELPFSIVIVLFRRHPKQRYIFLRYFDTSPNILIHPKNYLSMLCHYVDCLPIQWIVHHIPRIHDIRYASLLCTTVLNNCTPILPAPYELLEENQKTWNNYRKIAPNVQDISYEDAWKKFYDIRSSIKELTEYKFDITLLEYINYSKNEILEKLLLKTPQYSRTCKLLPQIAKLCRFHSIDLASIIIPTILSHHDWSIEQKLNIIRDFLSTHSDKRKALESLHPQNSKELQTIQDFANTQKIEYIPDPNIIIQAIIPSASRLSIIHHSNSSEDLLSPSIPMKNNEKSNTEFFSKPRRKSQDFSTKYESNSLYKIANGLPSNPEEYAIKLSPLKHMKEIKPIFLLAHEFKKVISYSDYHLPDGKKLLLEEFLQTIPKPDLHIGISIENKEFDSFINAIELSNDELLSIIYENSQFHTIENGLKLIYSLKNHIIYFIRFKNITKNNKIKFRTNKRRSYCYV